jgi:hypothetical protein
MIQMKVTVALHNSTFGELLLKHFGWNQRFGTTNNQQLANQRVQRTTYLVML